ncbi:MAG: hypothetical protein Kow0037_21950 [Calditrichia bacterium]
MSGLKKTGFFMIILLLTVSAFSFYHADGQYIVDSQGNRVQLRGIGLGGWIFPEGYMLHMPGFGSPTTIRQQIEDVLGPDDTAEFYRQYEANFVNEKDIRQLAEWGFDHIRLPFSFKLFYDTTAHAFREEGFAFVDNLLDWCKSYDMLLVLDMHGAPGGQNAGNISDSDGIEARLWTDTTNQTLAVKIWKEIARRYADEEQILGYDILNEPVLPSGYPVSSFRDFYVRVTQAIREVDPNHLIFIEGNWYATDFTGLTPPWDNNMAYSFHKYWSETDQASIQNMLSLRAQYNVPLWMSESGENSNGWFHETVRLFESFKIGWCWWTHKKLATTTSPMSINTPEGYETLQQYWAGQGAKPSREFAKSVLFQLAENAKLENCRPVKGVLEALFEPEFGQVAKPFAGNTIPGAIDAVNFDLGNQNVAYVDADYKRVRWDVFQPWNRGYQYRNDGVDIEKSQDKAGPEFSIGWIEEGEWIRYTVNVVYSGTYDVFVRVAGPDPGGKLRLLFNNKRIGQDLNVPVTSDWHDWVDVPVGELAAEKGPAVLEVRFLKGGFNFNRIIFKPRASQGFKPANETGYLGEVFPNPANPSVKFPVVLFRPAKVNIELFDTLGQKVGTVYSGQLEEGAHELAWNGKTNNGKALASGVYIYRVQINKKEFAGRLVLLK